MLRRTALIFVFLTFAMAAVARADHLVRTSGPPLDGKVLAESDAAVTFEAHTLGYAVRVEVPRDQVQSLTRDPQEGVAYCVLPVVGTIGEDVPADTFEQALARARSAGARWVILEIDSPGGTIDAMARMCAAIRGQPQMHFVAHVKQAASAAAIVALSCPRIYMAPGATIGAAVPFQISSQGLPEILQEKFAAQILAQMRSAAESAGHDPLLVRGMTELGVQLSVVTREGVPIVMLTAQVPSDAAARGGVRVLKTRNTILSVTAEEAYWCGLSAGTAASLDDVRQAIGIRQWYPADDLAPAMLEEARHSAQRAALARWQQRHALAGQNALRQEAQEKLPELRGEAEQAQAEADAARRALDALPTAYRQDVDRLEVAFRLDAAKLRPANEVAAAQAAAQDTYRRGLADLDARYQEQTGELLARRQAAAGKLAELTARYHGVVAPLQETAGAAP